MKKSSSLPQVAGFRFSGVKAGIKKNGKPDLGLIVADTNVAAAAVFTTNMVQAAPVRVARQRVASGRMRAVLVNSGNANACTGKPGLRATLATTSALAKRLGIADELVFPASTGVIGQLLPADTLEAALPSALRALSADGARAFSRAIMTTDLFAKTSQRTLRVGRHDVTLLGMAKGAGMIHPRMATTLAFVVTDAKIAPSLLRTLLTRATERSFNCASVDGETSTNDTLLVLASGASRAPAFSARSAATRKLEAALREVLWELAGLIVADGEGAKHVAEIHVRGLATEAEAKRVAERIAISALVKTALHGCDANWGRILSAAGLAGVPFDAERAAIAIAGVPIVKHGMAISAAAEAKAQERMKAKRYAIDVVLGRGPGKAVYLTSDLGHSYIDVNAGYRS